MRNEWHLSSHSGPDGGNCVECRVDDGRILLRDSQHREHGHLAFSAPAWAVFLDAVRRGTV